MARNPPKPRKHIPRTGGAEFASKRRDFLRAAAGAISLAAFGWATGGPLLSIDSLQPPDRFAFELLDSIKAKIDDDIRKKLESGLPLSGVVYDPDCVAPPCLCPRYCCYCSSNFICTAVCYDNQCFAHYTCCKGVQDKSCHICGVNSECTTACYQWCG